MKMLGKIAVASVLALTGHAAFADVPGRFVTIGPMDAQGDVLSMKWHYGYLFETRPDANAKVRFSCSGIPESAVSLSGSELKYNDRGIVFVDSKAVAVSKKTTPWLYTAKTTHTDCKVAIAGVGGKRTESVAPLDFAPESKKMLLTSLKESYEFNKPQPPAK
jgi:hypothetical protein